MPQNLARDRNPHHESPVLERLARLEERQVSHEDRDADRFETHGGMLVEIKDELKDLNTKVDTGFTKLGGDIGDLKVKLAETGQIPVPVSDYHIGPRAWALLASAAAVVFAVVGWLLMQVYDLQPSRIASLSSAQQPARVFRERPQFQVLPLAPAQKQ